MTAKEGQSIFDVTVQKFGTIENLFDFLSDNNLTLNSKLKTSQQLIIENIGKGNETVKNFVNLTNRNLNNAQDSIDGGSSYSNDYSNDYN